MKLLILIPAYNEEGAIAGVVQEVRAVLPGVNVLVVDDCSEDATITVARGAGIKRTYTFTELADWRAGAAEALSGPGPVVIHLKVQALAGQKTPKAPRPMAEQIQRLQSALA